MFPQKVKEKAMIACGRCCCLCHKFCGTLMECHHIVERSKGGRNTLENCIPLCFECHASVGHYNDNHPKGVKFSAAELRMHRANWFQKVMLGHSANAPQDYLELDKSFFLKLVNTLGGSQRMAHFRDHDYFNSYSAKIDDRLYQFLELAELPEAQFFDVRMETAFAALKDEINSYNRAGFSLIDHFSNERARIVGWDDGTDINPDPDYRKSVALMNEITTRIWEAYSDFIKAGRQQLKINLHH